MLARRTQQGAGIVEILIGLLIGTIIMMALYGSLSFYQNMKRTSISGDSAMANAFTAIYLMSQDIRSAGLGLMNLNDLACTTLNAYYNTAAVANGAPVRPVSVVTGATADSISLLYGSSIKAGAPLLMLQNMASSNDDFIVNLSGNVAVGDSVLLANPASNAPCTLFQVTNVQTNTLFATLSHASTSKINPATPSSSFTNAVAYPAKSLVMNVGNLNWVTWRLNNNNLERVNNLTGATEVMVERVMALKFEFGVSNGVTDAIQSWEDATGQWATLTPALIKRVRALRIAVVTQSKKRERDVDINGVCTTTKVAPSPWNGAPALDLSAIPNWQCYRYQTMSTVIPLKNIVWGASSS